MICIFLLACARVPQGEDLSNGAKRIEWPGHACELALRSDPELLKARVDVELRWRHSGCEGLPDAIRLVADMPRMSHGPREAVLQRDGDAYVGSLLFVMGGRWELVLFAGETELLRGWLDVAER